MGDASPYNPPFFLVDVSLKIVSYPYVSAIILLFSTLCPTRNEAYFVLYIAIIAILTFCVCSLFHVLQRPLRSMMSCMFLEPRKIISPLRLVLRRFLLMVKICRTKAITVTSQAPFLVANLSCRLTVIALCWVCPALLLRTEYAKIERFLQRKRRCPHANDNFASWRPMT